MGAAEEMVIRRRIKQQFVVAAVNEFHLHGDDQKGARTASVTRTREIQ